MYGLQSMYNAVFPLKLPIIYHKADYIATTSWVINTRFYLHNSTNFDKMTRGPASFDSRPLLLT